MKIWYCPWCHWNDLTYSDEVIGNDCPRCGWELAVTTTDTEEYRLFGGG
jgi:hypothetical protein